MSYAGRWPTADDLRLIVNVDPDSSAFDDLLAVQVASGIDIVKQQVGKWDNVLDIPDAGHFGAALRAAYLLSLKESPTAIVTDQEFMTYMHGKRRRFAIA